MPPDDDPGREPTDPQSWDLYSYVRNSDPIRTDPNGHDGIYIDNDRGKAAGFDRGDCDNSTEAKANSVIYVDGTVDFFHYDHRRQRIAAWVACQSLLRERRETRI